MEEPKRPIVTPEELQRHTTQIYGVTVSFMLHKDDLETRLAIEKALLKVTAHYIFGFVKKKKNSIF